MSSMPIPPQTYQNFVEEYPELAKAWELLAEAGKKGPLDEKTVRLVKLALAIGAGREGAVRAGARKALAEGITKEEIQQLISLTPNYVGLPGTVAAYSWVTDSQEHSQD